MKKIMILGAGLMQKPAILAAKKLGYESIVVDANSNAVSVPLADKFYPVDLKDREALAKLALEINAGSESGIEGVFTAGTDFSASVAYVAEKLGYSDRCHAFEACLNASDKVRMRGCFKKGNVPSPDFIQIDNENLCEIEKKIAGGEISFPKVAKPVDNMGGRGCRLVRNKAEFDTSVSSAVKNSRSGRAIFEDYMDGPEFSIDSIVYKGTLTITGFADRHIFYPPYFIEMGHTMPSSTVTEKMKNELIAAFALGIKSLGLTCGVAKADIKYTKNGPMIGEIAARLSGGYMSGWTYPYSSSFNLTEQAMRIALNLEPTELLNRRKPLKWQPPKSLEGQVQPFELFEVPSDNVSAERAWLSIPGKISKVYGLEKLSSAEFIKDVLPRVHEGDKVSFPRNNVEKCGNIISLAPTHEKACEASEKAVSDITIRLESFNKETDAFISGISESDEEGFPASAFVFGDSASAANSPAFSGVIKAGKKVSECVPEVLLPYMDTCSDWNHCTLRKTLEKFDLIAFDHPDLDCSKFWPAVIRGGIQAALYISDCTK